LKSIGVQVTVGIRPTQRELKIATTGDSVSR
jgi:hypothetical protein